MEKQNTKGRERMLSLFDAGTFVEMGAYIRRRGDKENQAYDAVLTGYGSVGGQLAFAFVQDSDKNAGALDSVGAEKIARLYEQAIKSGAPVVGVFDGARQTQICGVFHGDSGGCKDGGVRNFVAKPQNFRFRAGARHQSLLFDCIFTRFVV